MLFERSFQIKQREAKTCDHAGSSWMSAIRFTFFSGIFHTLTCLSHGRIEPSSPSLKKMKENPSLNYTSKLENTFNIAIGEMTVGVVKCKCIKLLIFWRDNFMISD